MAEFRQNFVTKEWVIIAPERALRPGSRLENHVSVPAVLLKHDEHCPFCTGNESRTGTEMLRYEEREGVWRVRVVKNKYSALDGEHSAVRATAGLFLTAGSYGYAEVVIESPDHHATFHGLSTDDLVDVLRAYRERAMEVGSQPSISAVMIFRNYGIAAGTSIEHPHSQIIASPIIPPHIRDPIQKAVLHYDSVGSCVYCDLIAEESRQRERVIYEDADFLAVCPFASRTPYEVRIYPRRHMASYIWISDDEIAAFARILKFVTTRIAEQLDNPSYNFIIRSAPVGDEDVRYLHWYFVLIPKIATSAGFEIGSGIYINACVPEECAARLRSA